MQKPEKMFKSSQALQKPHLQIFTIIVKNITAKLRNSREDKTSTGEFLRIYNFCNSLFLINILCEIFILLI